jgi:hypothetical protein
MKSIMEVAIHDTALIEHGGQIIHEYLQGQKGFN